MRLALLLALAAGPAAAQGNVAQIQQNVLDNLAGAAALASACPSLVLNDGLAAMALSMHGIAVGDGAAEMARRAARLAEGFGEVEEETVCRTATLLYGPEGASAPGLVVEGGD